LIETFLFKFCEGIVSNESIAQAFLSGKNSMIKKGCELKN